jgi:hypothetical protein
MILNILNIILYKWIKNITNQITPVGHDQYDFKNNQTSYKSLNKSLITTKHTKLSIHNKCIDLIIYFNLKTI